MSFSKFVWSSWNTGVCRNECKKAFPATFKAPVWQEKMTEINAEY